MRKDLMRTPVPTKDGLCPHCKIPVNHYGKERKPICLQCGQVLTGRTFEEYRAMKTGGKK